MGRPKLYEDAAAKHRAYRKRLEEETVRVDRRRWAALEESVNRLAAAVAEARRAGCPVANEIVGCSTDTVLHSLTAWFTARTVLQKDVPVGNSKGRKQANGCK